MFEFEFRVRGPYCKIRIEFFPVDPNVKRAGHNNTSSKKNEDL